MRTSILTARSPTPNPELQRLPQIPPPSNPDMAPSTLQHRRTHNLLLISKLLNQRDAVSPFTLVLDSLEQSAKPLIGEYVRRAKVWFKSAPGTVLEHGLLMVLLQIVGVHVVFVSFETLRKPRDVDTFIQAWSQSLQVWQRDVGAALRGQTGQSMYTYSIRKNSFLD